MTPSLNTENGVSSCGGRLVSPIIGRFCGYLTSGRSPLSNGSVTVSSAKALTELNPVAAPSAAIPARLMISRLSIMAPSEAICVEAGRCRIRAQVSHPQRASQLALRLKLPCDAQGKTPAARAAAVYDGRSDQSQTLNVRSR